MAVRAGDWVDFPIREYTRRRVVEAAAALNRNPDAIICGGIDLLLRGGIRPAIQTVPTSSCEDPYLARTGATVFCRRQLRPHPGRLHVWWDANLPGSREEWA
jgi:hypothetical protein